MAIRRLPRSGFTLMEVVLAIALTSIVMYMLTTAIELFMIRVDSSRSRVESAQLARTLLDQIAADLTATRLYAPGSGTSGSGGQSSGGQSRGAASGTGGSASQTSSSGAQASGGQASGGATGGTSSAPTTLLTASNVQGIYGTDEEVRIDRAAYANWQRAAREVDPLEESTAADMPATVRYYLGDGDYLSSDQAARQGVVEETATNVRGLYRETLPTAALSGQTDPLASDSQSDDAKVELLAPEVVKLSLQYFNGEELVDSWDSFESKGLPLGVEIRLTLHEPRLDDQPDAEEEARQLAGQFAESELVEYRRFVRILAISPQPAAEALLPKPAEQGEQTGSGNQQSENGQSGNAQAGAREESNGNPP